MRFCSTLRADRAGWDFSERYRDVSTRAVGKRFIESNSSRWSAAEPNLVSVMVTVRDLAHAVRIDFSIGWVESPFSDLPDERIEVSDEECVPGVTGVLRLLRGVDIPMLGKLANRLCFVRKECWAGAQQSLVPFQRARYSVTGIPANRSRRVV
jgi:hypothetical protein